MGLLDPIRKLRKPKAEPPPSRTEKGRSGTVNTRGFITSDEQNQALVFPRNLDTFDLMRKTDITVRWMLLMAKIPLLAAEWKVEPASQDPEALEDAALVEHCLFEELEGGFDNFLRQALLYLDFGHYVFYPVADFRSVFFEYEKENGDTVEIEREAFVLKKLAPRMPRTIQRWITKDDAPSDLVAIEQWLNDGAENVVSIPANEIVVFTNEQEGDDFRGVSLLRSAVDAWRKKIALENVEAIGIERSVGIPVIYAPNATPEEMGEYEELLSHLRQGENLYAVIPKPKYDPQYQPDGVLIEDLSVSGDGSKSTNGTTVAGEAIQRYKGDIATNVFAEFMRLGHEEVGARATSNDQQDPYYLAVQGCARYLTRVINEELVVKRILKWNEAKARKPPKVTPSKITAKNVQMIAEAMAKLIKEGLIIPDLELEQFARALLSAPQRKPQDDEDDPYAKPNDPPPVDPNKVDPATGKPFPPAKPPGQSKTAAMREYMRVVDNNLFALRASRDLHPAEQHVAFAEIGRSLDDLQDRLLRAAVDASRDPVAHALTEAVKADSTGDVDKIDVPDLAIHDAVLGVLEDAYRQGRMTIATELRSQGAAFRFEEVMPDPAERLRRLSAAAATVAASIAANATRAIRAFAIRRLDNPRIAPTTPGYEPDAAVRQAARGGALSHIAQAFGWGRRDEMLNRRDEIAMSVYSAILDTNNCGPCREADGREGPVGGSPDLPTPNPMCEGGGACRCMWIPVLKTGRGAIAYPEGLPDVALPEAA